MDSKTSADTRKCRHFVGDKMMNSTDPYWLHRCPHDDGRAFCKKCDRCREECCDCWIGQELEEKLQMEMEDEYGDA